MSKIPSEGAAETTASSSYQSNQRAENATDSSNSKPGPSNSPDKRKKFFFFSNLFKPKGQPEVPPNSTSASSQVSSDKVQSASSYESVNSIASTSSFTFVSSKKFKGKGHKGKRIPVDSSPSLPRPDSRSSSNQVRSRPPSGATLGSPDGKAKKLGTLSRLGVKIGLKKKYNLQSCESLEHIATLHQEEPPKKEHKKLASPKVKDNRENVAQASKEVPTPKPPERLQESAEIPSASPDANQPSCSAEEKVEFSVSKPEPDGPTSSNEVPPQCDADASLNVPCQENSGTWSNSTKRKRKAPPPPTASGTSTLSKPENQTKQSGSDEQAQESLEVTSSSRSKKVTYPSYPTGALRRSKSKEKSHTRPYSCSCSSSIFAHHSKYQSYHRSCCSEGKNFIKEGSNYNSNSITRTHVRGKKRAPLPPNPFEDHLESSAERESRLEAKLREERERENPYGNPFLDENESLGESSKNSSETSCPQPSSSLRTEESDPNPSTSANNGCSKKVASDASTCLDTSTVEGNNIITSTSVKGPPASQSNSASTSSGASVVINKPRAKSEGSPPKSNDAAQESQTKAIPGAVPLCVDEATAQNILNDRQEKELLARTAPKRSEEVQCRSMPVSSDSSNTKSNSCSTFQSKSSTSTTDTSHHSVKGNKVFAVKKDQKNAVGMQTQNQQQHMNTALASSGLPASPVPSPPPSSPGPSESSPSSTGAKVTPRPWYKRGIGSSFSKSSTSQANKAKSPTVRATFTHLSKFSDLDREAQRIVDENKRKSAEIAFNQNARDLINIFNTSLASSSNSNPVTPSLASSSNPQADTASSTATSNVTIPSSAGSVPVSSTIVVSNPISKSITLVCQSSTTTNSPNNQPSAVSNKTSQGASTTSPLLSRRKTIGMVSSMSSSSSSVSTTVTVQAPVITPPSTVSSSASMITTGSSVSTATSNTFVNSPSRPFVSSARQPTAATGESGEWTCPRCTLKNPAWRALCEVCYYRKLGTIIIPGGSLLEKTVVSSSSTTTALVSSSVNSSKSTPTPLSSTSKSGVAHSTPVPVPTQSSNQAKSASGTPTGAQPQRKTPPSENFLNQHPLKLDSAKDEKMQEMKLNNDTPNVPGEEVDIAKLREARLAFFAQDQEKVTTDANLNIRIPERPMNILGTMEGSPTEPTNAFQDGESDFIDNLIFQPPERPPKASTSRQEPSSSALPPTSGQGQQPSPPIPLLRYRPLLDPICEADASYYSLIPEGDSRIYQNWQSPQSRESESMANHFGVQNSSTVYPVVPTSQMRPQNISIPEESLASNFRAFANPNPIPVTSTAFHPGLAFPSNSHLLSAGFTSDSDTEVDSMDRRHRSARHRGYNSGRDNRSFGGGGFSDGYHGERNLSHDDYRRMGYPAGYAESSASSDSRRKLQRSSHDGDNDSRYFSESSETSMASENPVVASKLLRKLEWAIAQGEHRLAASLAHDLALLKVNCVVAKPSTDPITIRVYVEDRFMQQGPFLVQVLLTMTLKDLKSKIEGDWGIPGGFQKWILGKRMAEDDNITLGEYEVVHDSMAFLYLVTPQIENLMIKENTPPPLLPKKPVANSMSPPPTQVQSPTTSTSQNKMSLNQSTSKPTPTRVEAQSSTTSPTPPAQKPSPKPSVSKTSSSAQTEPTVSRLLSSGSSSMNEPKIQNHESPPALPPKNPSPLPLYERPSSPTRGERKQVQSSTNNDAASSTSEQIAAPPIQAFSSGKKSTFTPPQKPSNQPSNNARTVPDVAKSKNSSSAQTNQSELSPSLHAKLAELRKVAEDAFRKGLQAGQAHPPSPNIATTNDLSKPISKINTSVTNQSSRTTTVPSLKGNHQERTGADNSFANEPQKPCSSKSIITSATTQSTASPSKTGVNDPVPTPRGKKIPQQVQQVANPGNPIANSKPESSSVNFTPPKPQKVEGYCQTTLPFPASKANTNPQSSNTPKSSTSNSNSPALQTPQPMSSSAQQTTSTSNEAKKKHENTVIVANVLVSPIINHALLGTSLFLQNALDGISLSPSASPALRPFSPSLPTKSSISIPANETSRTAQNCKTENVETKPDPVSQPIPSNSKPVSSSPANTASLKEPSFSRDAGMEQTQKPFVPPCVLKKEIPKPVPKPVTKVKLMAEKFNGGSLSRRQSEGSILQQNAESSIAVKKRSSSDVKENNIQTYLDMVQLMEKEDLISSSDAFDCPVCFSTVEPGEGVTLRDCLHNFCKDCLVGAVQYAEESEVKCPFRNNSYSCNSTIQEREIKALVPADVFEKYLLRSVRLAERKLMNSFHCKTPDCVGWCIFEDDVNIFKCPICNKKNCITCAAIHEGMNCHQYQRQMAIAAETDEDAKTSRLMLEEMIERGDALECPACHVVLLKKWGCDWVKCTYCKTEICWVTRGFRWGPGGKGDTSGGCKCGVNGVRCHPKCTYCH